MIPKDAQARQKKIVDEARLIVTKPANEVIVAAGTPTEVDPPAASPSVPRSRVIRRT
jgi:hypothetical protein